MILIILVILFIILAFPALVFLYTMLSALISQINDILCGIIIYLFDNLKQIIIVFSPYFIGTLIIVTSLLVIIALSKELLVKVFKTIEKS